MKERQRKRDCVVVMVRKRCVEKESVGDKEMVVGSKESIPGEMLWLALALVVLGKKESILGEMLWLALASVVVGRKERVLGESAFY